MVVIESMNHLPGVCEECPMYSEDYWQCRAIPREFEGDFTPWKDKKPEWCPLKEVYVGYGQCSAFEMRDCGGQGGNGAYKKDPLRSGEGH